GWLILYYGVRLAPSKCERSSLRGPGALPDDASAAPLGVGLRHLDLERLLPLLAHDRQHERLARLVGRENAHRMLGRARLASADLENHVAVAEQLRLVIGRTNDEQAPLGAEI